MRLATFAMLIAISLFGVGCDDAKSPPEKSSIIEKSEQPAAPAGSTAPKPRVALVMKTLTNPFFIEMEKGARRAETELGVTLLVKTAAQETSIEQQIAIVDTLIREKVDAIVIAPGDSHKLIPVLKKAQEAGIAVVNIDNRLDPEFSRKAGLATVPFISVDNTRGAYLSAKVLTEGVVGPVKAAIIEGIRSAANAEARKVGALRAFQENPYVSIVAMETANWKIDEAYDVARTIFTRDPDIRLLFCANDMMALGAARYLKDAGLNHVRIAAYDALAEAQQAVGEGRLAATIDQQAATQGFLGVQYALRAMKGDTPPAETLVDVTVVTANTTGR